MKILIVTGSMGLVGSASVLELSDQFDLVIGIDNDARQSFFGERASGQKNLAFIQDRVPHYQHCDFDIRDQESLARVFKTYNGDISLIIHAAAQPSHDYAASDPSLDFTINALATHYLLECTRKSCPEATFIFTSTNKVYGDRPNALPLVEMESRYELASDHPYYTHGIDESMSIDQSTHSLFGVSKASADLMVQEYGRYFGLNTGVFRGGCLTGPQHGGAEMHGFLSYLVRTAVRQNSYTIYGYKGKQVRDNIHCNDLVSMFAHFHRAPRPGAVYNAGGGRHSNCSVLEAIEMIRVKTGIKLEYTLDEKHRRGDHQWWISNTQKFRNQFPSWQYEYSLDQIVEEIVESAIKE